MRIPKVLALVNILMFLTLTIGVCLFEVSGEQDISNKNFAEAAKKIPSEFGIDVLSSRIEVLEHRGMMLTWLCYGSLLLLVVNAFCWGAQHQRLKQSQPKNQDDETAHPSTGTR